MNIQVRARNVRMTKALRTHVALRLGFALGRFAGQIDRVAVDLSNSDDHASGAEKLCRIVVGLPRRVNVRETDADVFAAVARAADRAARFVARAIEQERERAESPPQPGIGGTFRRKRSYARPRKSRRPPGA